MSFLTAVNLAVMSWMALSGNELPDTGMGSGEPPLRDDVEGSGASGGMVNKMIPRTLPPLTFSRASGPPLQPHISSQDLFSSTTKWTPLLRTLSVSQPAPFPSFRFYLPTAVLLTINYYKGATSD